jgi:hypothetical protein
LILSRLDAPAHNRNDRCNRPVIEACHCRLIGLGQDDISVRQRPENNRGCLSKTRINFKLLPGVDGHPEICQLIGYDLTDNDYNTP